MSEYDFTQYSSVEAVVEDIKSVKIQGATNVAIATFEGIKLFINSEGNKYSSYELFINEVEKIGYLLANARPNEPLAQNGVKFIINMMKIKYHGEKDVKKVGEQILKLVEEYLNFIKEGKERIVENGKAVLTPSIKGILTHCHSSTAEKLIINHLHNLPDGKVVCTETRPLFQGRTTAKNLLASGLDTTLIADSAVESFIIGKGTFPIDTVFIGCDEITMQGDAVNKIGSWGVAHAAYFANKPVYIVGSILKTNVSTAYRPIQIEMRNAVEIWPEAPEGLKMVNPSFEIVDHRMITGFITELGVLAPDQIGKSIQKSYQWLF